jgi:3-methyladenine DNA glycosylase AlkD
MTPARAAAEARRSLKHLARPAGTFDASRYFRATDDLRFYNVGTARMRALAKSVYRANRDRWSLDDALEFAEPLVRDPYLDVKSVGIEVVALYRRDLGPRLLPTFKRWLRDGYSSNWATTDAICGYLIGPLLVSHPSSAARVAAWAGDSNMWVRRASAVSLIPSVRKGMALGLAYAVAERLHSDPEDLIQKAVGWMLREAGKTDPKRLERYLRDRGPAIPRTTLRYAIERFDLRLRRDIMQVTRQKRLRPERGA